MSYDDLRLMKNPKSVSVNRDPDLPVNTSKKAFIMTCLTIIANVSLKAQTTNMHLCSRIQTHSTGCQHECRGLRSSAKAEVGTVLH